MEDCSSWFRMRIRFQCSADSLAIDPSFNGYTIRVWDVFTWYDFCQLVRLFTSTFRHLKSAWWCVALGALFECGFCERLSDISLSSGCFYNILSCGCSMGAYHNISWVDNLFTRETIEILWRANLNLVDMRLAFRDTRWCIWPLCCSDSKVCFGLFLGDRNIYWGHWRTTSL